MTPAKEVGGDFYDFFFVDDDHIALVMADVAGKGIPAALFMIVARFQAPHSLTTNCIIEYYFDYCNKKSVPAVTVKNGQPATPQLIALLNTISIIAIKCPFQPLLEKMASPQPHN